MTLNELINNLENLEDTSRQFIGSISGLVKDGGFSILTYFKSDEDVVLFIDEVIGVNITIAEALEELKLIRSKYVGDISVRVIYGNWDTDIFSSNTGIEFKDSKIIVNRKS